MKWKVALIRLIAKENNPEIDDRNRNSNNQHCTCFSKGPRKNCFKPFEILLNRTILKSIRLSAKNSTTALLNLAYNNY